MFTTLLIGHWDYTHKNGNFQTEQQLIMEQSPLYNKILLELADIKQQLQKK